MPKTSAIGTPIARRLCVSAKHAPPSPTDTEPGAPAARDAAATLLGSDDSTTHFGFQTVDAADKEFLVAEVFSRVADKYDLMNDLMSAGLHREWKDAFVERLGPFVSRGGTRVLDVAGGTGDTAFRIVEAAKRCAASPGSVDRCEVVISDINPQMLAEGRNRAEQLGLVREGATPRVHFQEANAEVLPFESNSMDVYTITFGIRNVTDVPAALREARRVLKPGGRFMCLEFSQVVLPVLDELYNAYSFHVIPWIGDVVAGDRDSYQYLVESIRRFPPQQEFADMIAQAGFGMVTFENFTGGVVALHSGFKLPQ